MSTKVRLHLLCDADLRLYRKCENIGCLYGYQNLESKEFALTYSPDSRESAPASLAHRAMKAVLGFDLTARQLTVQHVRITDEMLGLRRRPRRMMAEERRAAHALEIILPHEVEQHGAQVQDSTLNRSDGGI